MTTVLSGKEIAARIAESLPDAIVEADEKALILKAEAVAEAASFLKDTPGLDFEYLNNVTAVDYLDYFEVVYRVTSFTHNHSLVFKTRCYDRDEPVVPSVTPVWRGAEFQEREVYDLMGISFSGHPDHRRILLWDGFPGHPLRKDFDIQK